MSDSNRFFIPESDGEALLEDPFIQGLRPFLRQLDWEQWQSILKRLQAISDHVSAVPATNLRPIGNPARLPQTATGSGNGNGHITHPARAYAFVVARAWRVSAAAAWCAGVSAAVGAIEFFV